MDLLQDSCIQCPYCWETIEIQLDLSVNDQIYTEDCQVCCNPIEIQVIAEDGVVIDIRVERENA
ncbi:MAG: CPXCG motif-containing cysteine-rich protein [Pseudomonadota bacterium]